MTNRNSEDDKEIKKEAIKEAMREWLDEEKKRTYESIGKWAFNMFIVILVGAMFYAMMIVDGWKKL